MAPQRVVLPDRGDGTDELRLDGVLRSSSHRRRGWLDLLLAAARHVVVLVREILVLAFAAIELVPLPILGGKTIVAIPAVDHIFARASVHTRPRTVPRHLLRDIVAVPAIDDILALASVNPVFARPTVEDVFAVSSGEIVISAKAAYLVIAGLTLQSWMVRVRIHVFFVGAFEQATLGAAG